MYAYAAMDGFATAVEGLGGYGVMEIVVWVMGLMFIAVVGVVGLWCALWGNWNFFYLYFLRNDFQK